MTLRTAVTPAQLHADQPERYVVQRIGESEERTVTNRHRHETVAGPMARFARSVLTVLGGAGFGLGAGALGTHGLLTLVTGGINQDGWGAAPAWLFMMVIGGGIGMIAGLALAIHHARNSEMRALCAFDWLGVLAGLAVAVLLFQFVSDRYYWFMKALYLSAIVPPCVVGGRILIGQVLGPRFAKRPS